jgi:hypothetical protein
LTATFPAGNIHPINMLGRNIMRRFAATLLTAAALGLASTAAALSWGAIAVDDSYGEEAAGAGYGFATEFGSQREAAAGAMDACQSEDNSDCKVVFTFKGCGAYAASRVNFGVGSATTLAAAEKRALADCDGPDCIVVVSDCE